MLKSCQQTLIAFIVPAILSLVAIYTHQAAAQDATDSKLSGTVLYTTDYLWHGYSKSDGNGAFQANLDYQHSSGVFGGLWVSTVDFGDDRFFNNASEVELIPYLGYSFSLSEDWGADIHWRRYIYNDDFFGAPGDYNEFTAAIAFRDLLVASIGVTDDGYDRGGVYGNYELIGRYPITDFVDFSTKVGYVQSREALNFDYLYWDAGVTLYYKFIGLDFRYFQSSRLNRKNERQEGFLEINPTFVFSVSLGF